MTFLGGSTVAQNITEIKYVIYILNVREQEIVKKRECVIAELCELDRELTELHIKRCELELKYERSKDDKR